MKLKINVTNFTIDSNKHHLETEEQYKIAIDPFDDKGIKVVMVSLDFTINISKI